MFWDAAQVYMILHEGLKIVKPIRAESRTVVTRAWREGEMGSCVQTV